MNQSREWEGGVERGQRKRLSKREVEVVRERKEEESGRRRGEGGAEGEGEREREWVTEGG